MVRIAYVINYIVKNGPSSVVLNLIKNLDKERYDITLITLFSGNDAEVVKSLKDNGVSVYECTTLRRMMCLLGQSNEFETIIKNGCFAILHTHGLVPDILSSRLRISLKKITTLHNNMYEDYLDSYGWVKSRVFIAMHLAALKKLDKCVCCSESVYRAMKRKLNNTAFVCNGIEPILEHSVVTRKEIGIPENARVFLYAGVLNSRKNVVYLIESFVRYHNEEEYLLVLGKGDKEESCRERADSHVRMLGFQSDPIAYMKISDVYASASRSEGFSISVLEALSCGLGLLLSDIPSHREVVEMGEDIYLGEVFNEEKFGETFCKLRESHFRKNELIKFQKEHLSAKVMTENYEKTYASNS